MNAYLFSEETHDSSYDKQCLYSFPKPVEQIKLPHKAHTKALSSKPTEGLCYSQLHFREWLDVKQSYCALGAVMSDV